MNVLYVICVALSLSLLLAIMRIVLIVINPEREKYFGLFVTIYIILALGAVLGNVIVIWDVPSYVVFVIISVSIFCYFCWDVYQEYRYYLSARERKKQTEKFKERENGIKNNQKDYKEEKLGKQKHQQK